MARYPLDAGPLARRRSGLRYVLGILADNGDALWFLQRQRVIVVLQQDNRLGPELPDELRVVN